jgi:hypothetical protein
MRQPKISLEFAVLVIIVVASFFSWMVWLTARVLYLGDEIVTRNYAHYEIENDIKSVEKKIIY